MAREATWHQVDIANNAAVSSSLDLPPGARVIGIETPDEWDTADLVLQVSRTGADAAFKDIEDIAGNLLRVTNIGAAAAEMRSLANDVNGMDITFGPHKVRLRSVNTASAADVNQSPARVLFLLVEKGN
jgi:hypothetical protein